MNRKGREWLGKLWALGLVAGILAGCSGKEEKITYDRLQRKAETLQRLQQLEKVIFKSGTEEESVLLIQYLPKELGSEGDEHFIIAGTPADRIGPSVIGRSSLDGQRPLTLRTISHGALPSDVRQRIPRWFVSYDVYFPHTSKKMLPLTLTIGGEKKTLYFYKGPKYLIEKKTLLK